ncbi:Acyl transferase/acyl hydrolase/lysophospholipase [Penicillium occitanis (nom. inval.)]|nr:Acyl transferase/acyl hydrolase/lysophospholipase [Penicillium occitanis (nom. inval.)]PCH00906.1 hypothetical protein PENOC_050710 [Penicillium occitanis (nom. inval.)]
MGDAGSSDPAEWTQVNGSHTSDEAYANEGGTVEPIAIVGVGCRLPGGATSPSKLWDLLAAGKSAWGPFPANRFSHSGFHSPSGLKNGTTNTNGGHFLDEDIAAFDAAFFGIRPMEATAIDPQQRLLLEVAYEAFENAGITGEELWGSNTGVYVGQWTSDYNEVLSRDTNFPAFYQTTGTGPAISSNRLSYYYNTKGPSFTVDTGCSASMVALHSAVQSLRTGETDRSFVAGVNLTLDPQRYTYQSQLKMFSDEGKSFPFDERANGYGRGEGCTGVVLQTLSSALKEGKPIRAIIRNSVLNQDGRTPGISVPSGPAQSAAIRKAYAQAGINLLDVDYVEAHGTGTKVGDPIEAKAIAEALSSQRQMENPLLIGSIKGNVGHLESAAGLTGMLKSILMLEKGLVPPQVNFERANTTIPLEQLKLRIPLELERRDIRRISVNCFGYGGTNAHVILDSVDSFFGPPSPLTGRITGPTKSEKPARNRLFVLSAETEKSAQVSAQRMVEYLKTKASDSVESEKWLNNLAYTLGRRSVFGHRAGVVASGLEDLITQFDDLSKTPIPRKDTKGQRRVGFVFSGQGAQYAGMGRELLGSWPTFTSSIKRAGHRLTEIGCSWDLTTELLKSTETTRVDEPEVAQPLSTAIQLALADSLAELDIFPSFVAGHSSGEIAAAYCAKAISFEDAMTVSYHRGRLASVLRKRVSDSPGGMLAVGESPEVVTEKIKEIGDAQKRIRVACFNSPSSVTVSGDDDAITLLQEVLGDADIFNRKLRTGGAAYHSHQMNFIESEYRTSLRGITGGKTDSSVVMVSSLTGEEIGDTIIDKDYWVQNLVSPVQFTEATKKLCQSKSGHKRLDLLLELGPHFQLGGPISQTLRTIRGDAAKIPYTGTLKRGTNAETTIFSALRTLFLEGFPVKLDLANNGFDTATINKLLTDVPPYSFDHSRTFWHESRVSKAYRNRKSIPHDLLGTMGGDYNSVEPRWRKFIRLDELPWLRGHIVQGQIVFPAAGYLAMAIQAIKEHTAAEGPEVSIKNYNIRNVSFGQALVLSEGVEDLEINFTLRPQVHSARKSSKTWSEFRVFTVNADNTWTEHCRGLINVELTSEGDIDKVIPAEDQKLHTELIQSGREINPKKLYFLAKDLGLDWTSPFDNVIDVKTTPGSAVATVKPSDQDVTPYLIHPAVLDACLFHSLYAVLIFEDNFKETVVPTFIKNMTIAGNIDLSTKNLTCYAHRTTGQLTYDIDLFDNETQPGTVVLRASTVTATRLPGLVPVAGNSRDLIHSIEWATYMRNVTQDQVEAKFKQGLEEEDSVMDRNQKLDALAMSYLQQALKEVSPEEVPEGPLKYWYAWMQTHASDSFNTAALAEAMTDETIGGQALRRLGPHFPDILRGNAHPLTFVREDDLLEKIYLEKRCIRCYDQIAAFCAEYGRQTPDMKVLEIGAGTASVTLPLLQKLKLDDRVLASRYDFTDISAGFFPAAKERLADFEDVVNYQVLNAENNPVDQGFTPNSYDILIACNVIHATSKIETVLQNVRSLLKPGGKFILMEITMNQLYYNLFYGAFSGWWSGYYEGRTMSPLLEIPQWQEKLHKAGFEQTKPMFNDYERKEGGTISVFVAHANETHESEAITSVVEVVGIKPGDKVTATVADKLKELLPNEDVVSTDIETPYEGDTVSVLLPDVCDILAGSIQDGQWEALKERITLSKAALFVTQERTADSTRPDGALISGFLRSLRMEHNEIRLISLEISATSTAESVNDVIADVLRSPSFDLDAVAGDVESEYRERDGQLYVPRVVAQRAMSKFIHSALGKSEPEESSFLGHDRVLTAELAIPGLLETVRWKDDPEAQGPLDPDHIKIRLGAASINFKDVLIASGQLEGINQMQNDCAGTVMEVGANMRDRFKPGDRVCALYSRSYTNYPIVHGDCCHVIPDSLTIEEAASLPIVWITVYYSIVDMGKLKKGESVLIHSGAGAVGQAAIMLAKYLGAEIFVTVGSDAKKEFLIKKFGIPEDHFFSSRNTTFYEGIMKMTGGRGVDVVLNSLSGEMFRESTNVVAPFGRFVEIGRKDLMDDALMPMEYLLKCVTFAYVDMALVIAKAKTLAQRVLHDVIELINAGAIGPVSIMTMPISKLEDAFRLIQAGKHIGKVILTVEEDQKVKILPPRPETAKLKSDATYIVVGGLGGLGKRIVLWMAERGAKNIVTFSRSGTMNEQVLSLIESAKELGTTVYVKKCDVSDEDQLKLVISELKDKLPPIRGIVQSAMILEDSVFDEMTYQQWLGAVNPKVKGTWNLHKALPSTLDFFVMLSSAVALGGNVGQSNYSAACAFQDALAHYRTSHGLATHSINVGAIVEIGYVSENPEVAASLRRQGMGTTSVFEFLSHLDQVIANPLASQPGLCQTSIGLTPSGDELGLGESVWMEDMKFVHVRRQGTSQVQVSGTTSDVIAELRSASTSEDAVEVICQAIIVQLSKVTALPVERLNPAESLDAYGVDSLVAVELRNWIGAYLQANVPLLVLRGTGSIQELAEIVTKESRLVEDSLKPKTAKE